MDRRRFIQVGALAGVGLAVPWAALRWAPGAQAQIALVQGVPLPGSAIPKFLDPLPDLSVRGGPIETIVAGADQIDLTMTEFQANVMPSGFVPANGKPYTGTWSWGYRHLPVGDWASTSHIGPVIVAERKVPTQIKWINKLGDTATSQLAAWLTSTDLSLHWANPANDPMMDPTVAMAGSKLNYEGPIPAVAHLHGGEIPPELDGGPDAWFLSDPANWSRDTWDTATKPYRKTGHAYYSKDNPGSAWHWSTYRYPNCQEAANIWFHDHVLGLTRMNVYAGLAGAYVIAETDSSGAPVVGLSPIDPDLPLIPVVIQDRMFDVDGQLFFPNVGINAEHFFWVPEFVGDTIVVNGKVWPFFSADRRRYRFLLLDGSNARGYDLTLVDEVTKVRGPRMWVIGTDGGYLDNPALVDPNGATGKVDKSLVMLPGERYEVVIDFNDPAWLTLITNAYAALGQAVPPTLNLTLQNKAKTPFPGGAPAPTWTTGSIMQFRVNMAPPAAPDQAYDPAADLGHLRSAQPIVRLVDPLKGAAAAGVTPAVTRQLTLNEAMGMGGPLEVLVNNTKWTGHSAAAEAFTGTDPGARDDFPVALRDPADDKVTYYSEVPKEGDVELWEIINLTADGHPIHLHLVQFQLMNRQVFDAKAYNAAYNALFPATTSTLDPMTGLPYAGGVFIGGFGPPLHYTARTKRLFDTKQSTYSWDTKVQPGSAVGGNPDLTPFLNPKKWPVRPPLAYERGWKDTVIAYPGEVTRIMVRWAPTDIALGAKGTSGESLEHFPFNPKSPTGHGYVWHCHIIDHEDNEMMRPDQVVDLPGAARSFVEGVDY